MSQDKLNQIEAMLKPILQRLNSQFVVDIQLRQLTSEVENNLSE